MSDNFDTLFEVDEKKGARAETNTEKGIASNVITGGIIGAIIGIPGSYFFQSEMVQRKCGGVGGYLQHLPKAFVEDAAWRLGVPQNALIGIAVLAVVGAIIGFIVNKLTAK